MCVRRGGGWGRWEEAHWEAGRRDWTQDAPDWALPAGQLKGPFLLIGTASAQTPPSPHSLLIQWLRRGFFDGGFEVGGFEITLPLWPWPPAMRLGGKGRGGGRLWSWKKERKERGGEEKAALRHLCSIPRLFWSLCKVEIWLQPLHREGKKPFKWKISCLSRSST